MTKKAWQIPDVKELNVKATEYGNSVTSNVDATYTDSSGSYYSFS